MLSLFRHTTTTTTTSLRKIVFPLGKRLDGILTDVSIQLSPILGRTAVFGAANAAPVFVSEAAQQYRYFSSGMSFSVDCVFNKWTAFILFVILIALKNYL